MFIVRIYNLMSSVFAVNSSGISASCVLMPKYFKVGCIWLKNGKHFCTSGIARSEMLVAADVS